MSKMSIRFILKSGAEFTTKCDKFVLRTNGLDQPISYEISGIIENKPIYLDILEIAAVVREMAEEND